jgi:hypothetical protein
VDKQRGIVIAFVAQAQTAYKSRLETEKENNCHPPNNISGAPMKHKKIRSASSPAVFVNSTSSSIATLVKKFFCRQVNLH